jgi:hypothetical protein
MTSVSILPSYLFYLESLDIPLRVDLPVFVNQLSRSGTPTVPKATCHSPIYNWNYVKTVTNEEDLFEQIEHSFSFDLSFKTIQ